MSLFLSQTSDPATGAASAASEAIAAPVDLLNGYAHIFVAAFLVTLLITPLVGKVAQAYGVVDRPDFKRKAHTHPIAYLGGVAVLAGLLAAIAVSYVVMGDVPASFVPVPIAVVVGMVAISFTGLADDVWGWDPRLKIAGQLVAAAALAVENVGVNVAAGVLDPLFGHENLVFALPTPMGDVTVDAVYWTGTALIALFVLGGCNAANLVDGLDGLLSGVTGIVAVGLLLISLLLIPTASSLSEASSDGVLVGSRIVLSLALLGAVLGFLPHNFKPASIFLGDCGSLLLGYMCVVIILMLGEHGETHLVCAGLIVFAVPIIDTTLAIIRRKLAGTAMSAADDQHLHHQLKRALGGVRRAVLALYTLSFMFAVLGVVLAVLVIKTQVRVRVIYAIAIVIFGMVGAVAVKSARNKQRAAARAEAETAETQPLAADVADEPVLPTDDLPQPLVTPHATLQPRKA